MHSHLERPKLRRPKASYRRRTGEALPRAEKFGDLITADHKVLSEGCESGDNHHTLSWYKILPPNGFNLIRMALLLTLLFGRNGPLWDVPGDAGARFLAFSRFEPPFWVSKKHRIWSVQKII